jgi:hypothetical protein
VIEEVKMETIIKPIYYNGKQITTYDDILEHINLQPTEEEK